LTGVAYLAIGFWVYRARGRTRPGRALAYFCVCTAMATLVLFDLASTHQFGALWVWAIAMLGGALISLGMRFPVAWPAAERHGWLLVLPYAVSVLISGWGFLTLGNVDQPWAYVEAWEAGYRYAAVGILFFLGITVRHAFAAAPVACRQARTILLGEVLAFGPIFVFLGGPVFGLPTHFEAEWFLPELLLFPIFVAVAILRYRLLEMDLIVNRAVVYATLTAILAGAITAGTLVSRTIFVAITGEKSDTAIIIITLIAASAFTPLKSRLQSFFDRKFKQLPSSTGELRQFGDRLQAFIDLNDPQQVTNQLVEQACRGLRAESALLSLYVDGRLRPWLTRGPWRGKIAAAITLSCGGDVVGLLALGPRETLAPYTDSELADLQHAASRVACILRLAEARAIGGRPGMVEKNRAPAT
jgi:hypothetical protein